MTTTSSIADSTVFKLVIPVVQMVLSAGVIGAFTFVIGAISSLQTQLGNYQTSQALVLQRVDSLERSRDLNVKNIDVLRLNDQKQDFRLDSIADSLKSIVISGRPK